MEGDDIFFTTVENPRKFRRDMLESSKELLTILKDYRKLMDLREEKKEKVHLLKEQFGELHGLMGRLDQYLPEESMQKLHEIMPEPEEDEEPEVEEPEEDEPEEGQDEEEPEDEPEEDEVEEPEEPEDEDMAKLENALQSIEEKLEEV